MNISDEAVEAAAIANYEARTGKRWSTAPNGAQAIERSWMRRALDAAAPHIAAEAWEEGREVGLAQDFDATTQITNPYRSQA